MRQVLSREHGLRSDVHLLPDTLIETPAEADGAEVGHLILVPALVEEAADLMHPALTLVASHPVLLDFVLVLLLDELVLGQGGAVGERD